MDEAAFILNINIIAENHNCRTVMIDAETKTINIEGPDQNQTECAKAICDFVESCGDIEEVKVPEAIREVNGIGWII